MLRYFSSLLCAMLLLIPNGLLAQKKNTPTPDKPAVTRFADSTFANLSLRSIGPAFMSGRIADVAIHPTDDNVWYVAVGSGGVWKTSNAGVTWSPVFENESSYSIGCVTIDPSNPNTVWVGTGENVGGRHVGFGDGVYRSDDGGASWKNMGLKSSEHISKIIVHPKDSKTIWVAAQGPLWSKGGDRGIYKTTDGGLTWKKTLGDSIWVGATDIIIDPRDPNVLYAATWQRYRTVYNFIGGGPGSGVWRSLDGGNTWTALKSGLPSTDMGKIGLAISPQQPDVIYAAIETERKTGGLYRSTDRGMTWERKSGAVAGGTGPHYYQELYASPHQFDRIYLMDYMMQVSEDGGATWALVNTQNKHVDNHVIAFRKDDPDYMLVGTDGGLYESFDLAKNWRFMENLPVTQFYKVSVDDQLPFYNIYGGTQDNSSQGGPSRTDNRHGIQNSDWRVVLDWDGHQTATEPGNPNIIYAERQEGQLSRIDMTTGEAIDIQPETGQGEPYERFNWDAPILISPHSPTRVYFASQRVWRSDDRGDSWTPISGDLTRQQERFTLPLMDKVQSWDEPWDVNAMSNYNTITSLAESPVKEGVIYAGTDDGRIQTTEDSGAHWRMIDVSAIPGVPATAFVNDIKADLFDVGTVYVALDNHKYGDFTPYLMKSTDMGKTWKSLRNNLPDRTLVWRIVQDHVQKNLMFLGTEFGLYFTLNGGTNWIKIKGGCPTIPFRDLTIQRRENDLVGASFGRGFFILDDYSFLREVSDEQLGKEATLFAPRKALWYIPRPQLSFDDEKGSLGADHFVAPNPPFGAVFTYYLRDQIKSLKTLRQEKEKTLRAAGSNIPFPGWDSLEMERTQDIARIWLTITDSKGQVVRRIACPTGKGFQRVAWDLKYPATDPIRLNDGAPEENFNNTGFLAPPGTYTATLSKQIDGVVTTLGNPVTCIVEPLRKSGALPGNEIAVTNAFWRSYEEVASVIGAEQILLSSCNARITALQKALRMGKIAPGTLDQQVHTAREKWMTLQEQMNGNGSKTQIGEKYNPTINFRMFKILLSIGTSTYGPTKTNQKAMDIIRHDLADMHEKLTALSIELDQLENQATKAGAPWIESEVLPPLPSGHQ